jgi:hypothetical protein
MNRRRFLSAIAALPVIGRLLAKAAYKEERSETFIHILAGRMAGTTWRVTGVTETTVTFAPIEPYLRAIALAQAKGKNATSSSSMIVSILPSPSKATLSTSLDQDVCKTA